MISYDFLAIQRTLFIDDNCISSSKSEIIYFLSSAESFESSHYQRNPIKRSLLTLEVVVEPFSAVEPVVVAVMKESSC